MSKWLLIIGVILGIVTAVMVNMHIANVESSFVSEPFLRLKPAVSLAKGDKLKEEMVQTQALPESMSELSQIAIKDTSASRAWVTGRTLTKDVPAGSFLMHEHFSDLPEERFSASIEKGMRAITLPVSAATAVAYFVQPGSRVDIIGTFEADPTTMDVAQGAQGAQVLAGSFPAPSAITTVSTQTLLQNIPILAVGRATSRNTYQALSERGFSTITVAVSPTDAEILVFAMQHAIGSLTLTLRNPGDDEQSAIPEVSWDSLKQAAE